MSVGVLAPATNAFIDALPEAMPMKERIDRLTVAPWPPHREEERGLPHHLRREAVLRLKGYFKAGLKHGRWAEGLYLLIKQGYMGRSSEPAERDKQMLALAGGTDAHDLTLRVRQPTGVLNKAGSAGLFGFAGMGKTFMVEHALSRYDQVKYHPDGAAQIVWLKLDCPPEGGLRELCMKFFHGVDDVLGRGFYATVYAGTTASEESMLIAMRRVARNHALGCLVIDEIQHLTDGGEEERRLLTFLVNLVNDIGVPVLFVGTMKAKAVIKRSDTLSRRMVGLGGGDWDRLAPRADGQRTEWDVFIEALWKFQWTNVHTPLTDEIRKAFFEETQGIVDLVVKLFCIVQMRLILIGEGEAMEGNKDWPEVITAEKVREWAREEFEPVRDMLNALAHGRHADAVKFGDYSKLQKAMQDSIDGMASPDIGIDVPPEPQTEPDCAKEPVDQAALQQQLAEDERLVLEMFMRFGHAEDIVAAAVRRAKVELGDRPAIAINLLPAMQAEFAKIEASPVPANDVLEERFVEGDLRRIARDAHGSGRSVYQALCAAGLAGPAAALRVA